MNSFRISAGEKKKKAGFGLAEATFSLGIVSFGFLCLAPLFAQGIKASRQARDERISAQIAENLVEQARQGAPPTGPVYLDDQGAVLSSAQTAAFTATSMETIASGGALTQMTLHVTPTGSPNRARVYAVVFPTPAPASN